MTGRWRQIRRYAVRTAAVVAVVAVAAFAWNAVQVYVAWRSIDRVAFDLDESRERANQLAASVTTEPSEPGDDASPGQAEISEPTAAQTVFRDEEIDVFLLVGSDDGTLGRADAVLLFVRPEGGRSPLLMSLPRDLSLVNPCNRQIIRLTLALEGCGDDVSGPELLALTVENFTTLRVDHFAVISFGAFRELIDRLDGVEVCVDNESRFDPYTVFPPGCSTADGAAALAWVRSRTPEEMVEGEWRAAEGGDEARSVRQQELLVQLLRRLRSFKSPLEVADLVEDLADAVVLDDRLSMGAAIDLAWEMRNINPAAIERPVLPVREQTLRGKFTKLPTQPFPDLLAELYEGA